MVPVFVESGAELLRFFELDAVRLEAIINDGVEPQRRVDRDDIALMALIGAPEPYAALKLSELNREDHKELTGGELSDSVRQYLYAKYVYRNTNEAGTGEDGQPIHPLESMHLLAGGRND